MLLSFSLLSFSWIVVSGIVSSVLRVAIKNKKIKKNRLGLGCQKVQATKLCIRISPSSQHWLNFPGKMLLSLVSCPHFITSFWHFTFEIYTILVSFRSYGKQQLCPRCLGNVTRLYLFVSDKTPSMNIYILLRVKFSLTNHVSKLPLMYWISFQTKHSTFLAITEISQIIPSTTEIHVLA